MIKAQRVNGNTSYYLFKWDRRSFRIMTIFEYDSKAMAKSFFMIDLNDRNLKQAYSIARIFKNWQSKFLILMILTFIVFPHTVSALG